MLFVVADASVFPHNRARFLEAAEAMITASRAEAGCLGYDYAWDLLEPDRLRALERWRDADALRYHFRTPHMAAFLAALRDMKNPVPAITVFEASNEHPIGGYSSR